MKELLKYKIYFIVVGIAILVIGIIYFIGRRAGKRAADNPWQAPLPTDIGTGDGSSNVDFVKMRAITDKLYADLDQWDWQPFFTRDVDAYKEFLALSDTAFVAVYNDFNSRFSKEFSGKSLRAIIRDETVSWGLGQFVSIRDAIEQRFGRLSLPFFG